MSEQVPQRGGFDPYLAVMAFILVWTIGAIAVLLTFKTDPAPKPRECPPPEYVVLPTPPRDERVPLLALEDPFEGVSIPEPDDSGEQAWPVPVAARCQWTRVSAIGPRLEPSPDEEPPKPGAPVDYSSGIALAFTNGVGLVSYSSHPVIEGLKEGARVQVCLYEEMRGCPPGDNRGKSYRVYDPKQGAAFSMGDSQHVCGGA